MNKIDLVEYETPAIAEYIPFGWIQSLIASYVAWKVDRKIALWAKRQERKRELLKWAAELNEN